MAKYDSITVLTGAGVSAESGIATFRGAGGLWENHSIEEVATPQGFARDPLLVWRFYEARRAQGARCAPNAGHLALARLEHQFKGRCTLVTQNVDGLHTIAGSRRILELHGSLWRVRCTKCSFKAEDRRVPLPEMPPRCSCKALLRPDIVWFGEPLDETILGQAIEAADNCGLFLVVGTSGVVEPAASLARIASANGAEVWEVNPEATPLTPICARSIHSRAGAVMDDVVDELVEGGECGV